MPSKKSKAQRDFEKDLTERVKSLSLDHVRCRDIGHVWREFTPATITDQAGPKLWRRALRCDKKFGGCGAERIEMIEMTGEIARRSYNYPNGYQMKGLGVRGGLSKSWFRREYIQRLADPKNP